MMVIPLVAVWARPQFVTRLKRCTQSEQRMAMDLCALRVSSWTALVMAMFFVESDWMNSVWASGSWASSAETCSPRR